eukprot:2965453-Amphidinium_carterae.1
MTGPSSKPSVTEDLVSLAAAAQAEKAKQLAQAERVDSSAVARCKKGELPPKGWASRWNAATKRQALIVALDAGQTRRKLEPNIGRSHKTTRFVRFFLQGGL